MALFYTRSEGVLSRERVPGDTILYIRDTYTDTVLWSRAEETDAPHTEEADVPLPVGGEAPQESDEVEVEVEVEEDEEELGPQVASTLELPVAPDAASAPEEKEEQENVPKPTRVKFNTDIEVLAITAPGTTGITLEATANDAGDQGPKGHAAVTLRAGNIPQVQCRKCGDWRLEGQRTCVHCGHYVTKGSRQSTFRIFMSQQRNKILDEITRATGQRLWEIDSASVRKAASSHDHRGAQSVDGRAISLAKQSLKQFTKHGFTSMVDKFDNDADYALHAVRNGLENNEP